MYFTWRGVGLLAKVLMEKVTSELGFIGVGLLKLGAG